jgi:hypothetical protein
MALTRVIVANSCSPCDANPAAGARRVLGAYSRGVGGPRRSTPHFSLLHRCGTRRRTLAHTKGKRRAGGSIAGYSGGTRQHSAIGLDGDEDAGAVVWCRRALRSIPSQRGATALPTVLQRSRASLQHRRERWKSKVGGWTDGRNRCKNR